MVDTEQSKIATALMRGRALGATYKDIMRRQFPNAAAVGTLSFAGAERLGARISDSKAGWMAMFVVPLLLFAVDPAAAQVQCNSGLLKFFGSLQTLTVETLGFLLIITLISAGILKMVPWRGTEKWSNAAIAGFCVGALFLILGPVIIDLADAATPIDLSAQCKTGGGK
jgi:hypothetical protein